ncbi:MAG: HD domain-containing protein [Cyanobacteria bacterium SIG32]|nr:HD domain-containing protein [Cyanobacteria bacterium SIG32]
MFDTETIYEVVVFSIGDTKAGTKMGKLQLRDPKTDTLLNCILWEETLNRLDSKLFRTGNQLRIVSATFNEKFNNCLVSALELVKEAKMGLDETQREETYQKLVGYINTIQDDKLRIFLFNYFEEHKEVIKIMPAAKVMHHNYIGGLMVHTIECVQFAEHNLKMFMMKLNRDVMISACILHDIGKIFEYTINLETGIVDYDENFRSEWISHSQYGFSLCMMNGFKRIAKMIAAHHGREDWGAMIDLDQKDLEPELYFLHFMDNLSAKFGRINVAMLEGGLHWQD